MVLLVVVQLLMLTQIYFIQMPQFSRPRACIPSFLLKLLQILEDKDCQQFIIWLQNNNCFHIIDLLGFTENVLPKYFKHKNYASFVRQLNLYGFSKIKDKEYQHAYFNPKFKKGSKSGLKKIQRKVCSLYGKDDEDIKEQKTQSQANKKRVASMSQMQNGLQQKIKQALSTNKQIFYKNRQVLVKMGQKDYVQENLIQKLISMFNIGEKQNSEIEKLKQSTSMNRDRKKSQTEKEQNSFSQDNSSSKVNSSYLDLDQFQQFIQFSYFNSENLKKK